MANRRSLGYLIKQGFHNILRNGMMSFASVSVLLSCLLLVGGSVLIYVNIQKGIDYVGSLGEIVLFVEDGATEYECSRIEQTLNSVEQLHDVKFISSSEGLEELKSQIENGDELFALLDGDDVLPASFRVKVTDSSDYEAMVSRLSQINGIASVSANGKIAGTLTKLSNAVALFAVIVVAVLMVVSVFIIANTLKLAIFSRRLEIYIMKMVGATDSFIQIPFFVEGVVLGLIAAVLGYFGLSIAYVGMVDYLTDIGVNAIPWESLRSYVAHSFLAAGFLTGLLSSSVSIKKYMRY